MFALRAHRIFGMILVVVGLALVGVMPVEAAEDDELEIKIKARAVSAMNITRAAADLVDIRILRWSTDEQRQLLVKTLETKGNHALAAELDSQDEAGWVSFDPRGGGGPGRDPRRAKLRYSREIVVDGTKEVILITNNYIGYGPNPQARDGAKLAEYPISFVLLKLQQNEDGEWTGVGRMFVGAKVRYDAMNAKLVIDEFPTDPVYLKDVKVK